MELPLLQLCKPKWFFNCQISMVLLRVKCALEIHLVNESGTFHNNIVRTLGKIESTRLFQSTVDLAPAAFILG